MDRGLVIVNTGNGKGKTTAALGLCMRMCGWGKKVCVVQFLKSPEFACGEKEFCKKYNIPLYSLGIGYSWKHTPQQQHECLKKAWAFAKKILLDAQYDLVVLDEINNVLSEKRLDVSDIITEMVLIDILKNRPSNMHVVLTGRNAGERLIAYADTVSEINCVKHAYEKGISAYQGIEY